ncbi:MAG: TonB-dependent receptor, partial [Gammaproteobacteria bacterium]|nr:TonB-dependent receptor [Gammaproteobacteria bacterium]
ATNLALFGQFDHKLALATRVSTGFRIERRSSDYSDTAGLEAGPSETMWGGEVGISHDFRNHSAYATLSKGYKAGGFNLGIVPDGNRDFGSEELWTIEAGIKSMLLEHRLLVNSAIFHYRRLDQQVRTSIQLIPGDPASFVFFTDNVGTGEALGIEVDARWYPSGEWELYASLGLIDATLENGRGQAHAPPFTLAAGVSYQDPKGYFVRLDASAKDAFYFDVSHDQKSQSYQLFNVRIGRETETWLAAFWVRNLFDELYAVRGFYFGNEPPDFPDKLYTRSGDPRQLGVTIERRF